MGELRRIMVVVLALVLGTALFGCAPRYVAYTKQGDALQTRGDYEGARSKYEAAVSKYPRYAPAIYKLGRLEVRDGNWESATKFFSAAITADPQLVDAYRWRGEGLLRAGELDKAGEDLRKARVMGSKDVALPLGIFAYLAEDYELAFENLREAVERPEDASAAARFLFKAALASGELAKASDALAASAALKDARAAAAIQRLRVDLAYAKQDYSAARELLPGAEDPLSFGFWYTNASPSHQAGLGAKGVVVEYVHLGSPAARLGMQASDLITSFERTPVVSQVQLAKLLAAYDKQVHREAVLIEVLRGGEFLAFRIMPGTFNTGTLIQDAASGAAALPLSQAPNDQLLFP